MQVLLWPNQAQLLGSPAGFSAPQGGGRCCQADFLSSYPEVRGICCVSEQERPPVSPTATRPCRGGSAAQESELQHCPYVRKSEYFPVTQSRCFSWERFLFWKRSEEKKLRLLLIPPDFLWNAATGCQCSHPDVASWSPPAPDVLPLLPLLPS